VLLSRRSRSFAALRMTAFTNRCSAGEDMVGATAERTQVPSTGLRALSGGVQDVWNHTSCRVVTLIVSFHEGIYAVSIGG